MIKSNTSFTETAVFKMMADRFNLFPIDREKRPYSGFKWRDHSGTGGDLPQDIYVSDGYGIKCGEKSKLEGLYLLVVDFDNMEGHKEFFENNSQFKSIFEETVKVKTYWGYHYYFYSEMPVRGRSSKKFGGVDIKAFGGYVAGAGSVRNVRVDSDGSKAKSGKGYIKCDHMYQLDGDVSEGLNIVCLGNAELNEIYDILRLDLEYVDNKGDKKVCTSNYSKNNNYVITSNQNINPENSDYSHIKKLSRNLDIMQACLFHIGRKNPDVRKYLEYKGDKYKVEDRSMFDYIAVGILKNTGYVSEDIVKFFQMLDNPNVRCCREINMGNYRYFDSLINSADKNSKKLADKRQNNRPEIEVLKNRLLGTPPEHMFKRHRSNMQQKLFSALLAIVNQALSVGFTEKFIISGLMLSEKLGCHQNTTYKRLKDLAEYGYIEQVVRGNNVRRVASRYTLNRDVILAAIEHRYEDAS